MCADLVSLGARACRSLITLPVSGSKKLLKPSVAGWVSLGARYDRSLITASFRISSFCVSARALPPRRGALAPVGEAELGGT